MSLASEEFARIIRDYRARNEALEKRVKYLEWRLEQRTIVSRKDFEAMQPFIENIKQKIITLFHDLPATMGYTSEEIQEEFVNRWPMISTVNLYRRLRDLVTDKTLWSCPDENNKVHFYLKLKEVEEDVRGEETH